MTARWEVGTAEVAGGGELGTEDEPHRLRPVISNIREVLVNCEQMQVASLNRLCTSAQPSLRAGLTSNPPPHHSVLYLWD